jgi:hypothetical protein
MRVIFYHYKTLAAIEGPYEAIKILPRVGETVAFEKGVHIVDDVLHCYQQNVIRIYLKPAEK